jgi:single-stranded-DNA-specific exonuclease
MNVAFGIAPRINAAGRIKHAHYAVEVLLSKSEEEAEAHAKEIDDFNQTRKELDSSITEEALEMISSDEKLKNAKSTVLYGENWHKGVIGIVASRCIESYYRPTIILTKSGDKVVGSARSVLGYSVYDAILACEDTITQFGGHKYAAGLTLTEEQVKPFQEKFEEYVAKTISEEQVTPQLDIDMALDLDKVNQEFYDDFVQVAPFGPMNEEPVFITKNVYLKRLQTMKEEHLRLELYQNEQKTVNALGFKMSKIAPNFKHGVPFDITYTLQQNEYKGIKKIQLVLKDIHFS